MKVKITNPKIFTLVITLYLTLISFQESPESKILGGWKEVSCEYEKVDSFVNADLDYRTTANFNQQLSETIIFHNAEILEFDDRESLKMHALDQTSILNWKIKGRGNILQLKNADDRMEYYEIRELTSNRLVIHFSFEMQVRGIVKMTFEKI